MGHAEEIEGGTGCTVILCPDGTSGGMDIRGPAAGTRQTDALLPGHLVTEVHAIFLAGGSAFGLDAAAGVMRYLEERGKGIDVFHARIPIVPGAIIFDLGFKRSDVRPTAEMAYKACKEATSGSIRQGSVGAGTGATCGKIFGIKRAMKSGLGTSCIKSENGRLKVGALAVANPYGNIVDPYTGRLLAGARKDDENLQPVDVTEIMMKNPFRTPRKEDSLTSTTLAVVATNALLIKEDTLRVARMAHNGLARVIRPYNTIYDGDIVFVLSAGKEKADLNAVGVMAGEALVHAVLNAVKSADGLGFLPAYKDLVGSEERQRAD